MLLTVGEMPKLDSLVKSFPLYLLSLTIIDDEKAIIDVYKREQGAY